MSPKEALLSTVLRLICHIGAWVIYHVVTLYDKTRAVYAIVRNNDSETLETSHRFSYPPIRLHRYWHTTRLLRLAPGAGIEPLEGVLLTNVTIKIFSFAWTFGEHNYHAISYCWGDSTVTKMIYLNGKLLPITESLHSALQRQRRRESPVVLWADQICIDQSQAALDERSQQVQRMGEIFSNADCVIIWLGEPTASSDEIFRRLVILGHSHQPDQADDTENQTAQTYPQDDTDSMFPNTLKATRRPLGPDEDQDQEDLRLGLEHLVNNAWFRRIWVLQEAALAKDLFIQAGGRRVPWMRFVEIVGSLQDTTEHSARNVQPVYDIEMLRKQRFSNELEAGDLLMMVEAFRGRQATDVRDKIYGLFGLATPLSLGPAFRADYSKSPEQVFVEFALWHIQVSENVRVLAKSCSEEERERLASRDEQPRLPSWCTDWSVTSSSDCGDLVDDYFPPKNGVQLYGASRNLRANARIVSEQQTSSFPSTSNAVLVLTGIIMDTVDQVVDRKYVWRKDVDLLSDAWTDCKRMAFQEQRGDQYQTRADYIDELWRTLVVDRIRILERTSRQLNFGSLLGIEDVIVDPITSRIRAEDGTSKSRQGQCHDAENLHLVFSECVKKWDAGHLGKRIFRTERGHLGMSCGHVQKGDRVAVLWGGRLPFLLRQHGSILLPGIRGQPSLTDDTVVPTYRLIGGECYVHGLADGEGLEIAEKVGILPTKICLV